MILFFFLIVCCLLLTYIVKKSFHISADPKIEKDFLPKISFPLQNSTSAEIPFSQLGGTINDASGLNRTAIYGKVKVTSEEDLRRSLIYARNNKLKVSIAGARHSMGGQAFAENSLVIEMLGINKMKLNESEKTLLVGTGALWHDVLIFLQPYSLSVKSMQSISILTVGGALSANAHGMDFRTGGIASTVRSMKLMLANGEVVEASKDKNKELFESVLGGYGLLAVIMEVELELMENNVYEEERIITSVQNFSSIYRKVVEDSSYELFYARLSTAPSSFLKEMTTYAYRKTDKKPAYGPDLKDEVYQKLTRLFFNFGVRGSFGREFKWWAEKTLGPILLKFPASRNQVLFKPLHFIKNNLRETDILQEYFVAENRLTEFISELANILNRNQVVTRNVEIRVVHEKSILLDYSKGDMFGIVLYLNQKPTEEESLKVSRVHKELIDLSQKLEGSFYLTYQLDASKEQLMKSYPTFQKFLELKKKYDTKGLFSNSFFEKYK